MATILDKRERAREAQRRFRERRPDYAGYMREASRRYREKHPDRKRRSARHWREKNPDYAREYVQERLPEYRLKKANHQLARQARQRKVFVEHVDRQQVYERYEGFCAYPRVKLVDRENFHVDHRVP